MSSNDRPSPRVDAGSLQTRLIRSLLFGCGLLFLLLGAALDRAVVHWLAAELDRSLLAQARALVSLSEQTEGEVEFDFIADLMPEFERSRQDREVEFFQLWLVEEGARGVSLFERSPSLRGADLQRSDGVSALPRFLGVELPGGGTGRQVQVEFVPQVEVDEEEELDGDEGESQADEDEPGGEEEADDDAEDDDPNPPGVTGLDPGAPPPGVRVASLVVARPVTAMAERMELFRWALVGGGLLLMLMTSLLVRLAVRRGLRPLRDVSAQVDALDAERLDQRIEIEPPAELSALVAKLNELLERLAAAFERERRFSSDVAHELRTPIAELRSLAEIGGRWPDDPFAVRQFFGDARQIAEQMEQVVTQLLAVARTEAGIEGVAPERFDLRGLVLDVVETHRAAAAAGDHELEVDAPDEILLYADAGKLRLVLHNALANGVAYAPRGGTLHVAVESTVDGVVLEVANPAEGLTAEDLEHVFERFWRKDEARARAGSSGLGLALVRSLCTLMGVRVTVRLDAEVDGAPIFVLSLRFPREAVVESMHSLAS